MPFIKGMISSFNFVGLQTLYMREVSRFLKVWNQTVTAPVVTTLLFLAVLTLALGRDRAAVGDIPYMDFIVPGLIMMAVVQNAFANVASSLMLQKFQGVIIDLLMPPLSAGEVALGMIAGGVTRGLMVAVTVSIAMYLFAPFEIHSLPLFFFYLFTSSVMLASLGLLCGIWAQSFDQMSAITNYVITPFSFLSGTFYSITRLPEPWYTVSLYNPFFYMIDGFRYAMTGHSDGNVQVGMLVLSVFCAILITLSIRLFASGYRLKS